MAAGPAQHADRQASPPRQRRQHARVTRLVAALRRVAEGVAALYADCADLSSPTVG